MTFWQTINGFDAALITWALIATHLAVGYYKAHKAALKHLSPRIIKDLAQSKSKLDSVLADVKHDTATVKAAQDIIRQRGRGWDSLNG